MNRHEVLISWLNDAYATETGLIDVLESHAKHAENVPEMRQQYEAHLAQTRRHAELVEECLHKLGSEPSTGTSTVGKIAGWVQGMASSPAGDTVVKDALADYSMEHFEIASYRGLIAGAEHAGESEIAETCRNILKEEQDMARFLEDHIPQITQSHLSQQAER